MNGANTTPDLRGLRGFDFGTSFNIGVPIVPRFAEHLHAAGVEGCAYGQYPISSLRTTVPSISLIGTNADSFRSAFAEFRDWTRGSDADAVQMHFIFLKKGGYILGITPDQERWEARTTSGDPMLDPLLLVLIWMKPIDTVHPMLTRIRNYYQEAFTAPIAFTAAVTPNPGIIATATGLLPIEDIEPLVKFKWHFVDEASASDPASQMILRIYKQQSRRSKKTGRMSSQAPIPSRSKDEWNRKRRTVLHQVFPVTTARFHRSSIFDQIQEALRKFSIRPWQIDQAVANLILSKEVASGTLHYAGVGKDTFDDVLLDAARRHVEISDSKDTIAGLDIDSVITQIKLDIRYLLKAHGKASANSDLQKLQGKLIREGLADEA